MRVCSESQLATMATGDGSTRIAKMLKETVILLCQNSLTFTAELHVQALLAVTVDHSTICVVQVDEKMGKDGESVSGGAQSQVSPEQRPAAARRLALPPPPAQASGDRGTGLAWPLQSPPPERAVRARGPRLPVGRGRGMSMRGGRGRGGATIRRGGPPVRMIRTAVSSVRFPVSRPRMQAPRGAGQRLALMPAGAGSSPRQMPTTAVRQRAPAPVRQAFSPAGIPSPPVMRKPSPRLAIMPSNQSPTTSFIRQQIPKQAGSVRAAASPRGVGRPRLAIMPSPQQPSPATSQSFVLRSPTQARAMPPSSNSAVPVLRQQSPAMMQRPAGASPQGRPRLAIMPSPQQPSPAASQSLVLRSPTQARAMPPTQASSSNNAPSGLRQQSPAMLPRQAGASPQGRPRLAIMPSQQSSANAQSLVLRSPTQLRAVPPQSSPRLALMPPHQSPVKSPHGTRQQTPTTLPQSAPAKSQIQLVARPQLLRQQSPAVQRHESNPSFSPHLARLASQLSSSSVGTQLHAVVENLSQQPRQPGPVEQSTPSKSITTVTLPLVSTPSVASQPMQSAPTVTSAGATRYPVIAVNLSQAGNLTASSVTVASMQPVRTTTGGSRAVCDTAKLSNQLISMVQSQMQPAAMLIPGAVSQQRAVTTIPASKTNAAVSCQPIGCVAPASSYHASLYQPYLTTQAFSGVTNNAAQNSSMTGADGSGLQTPRPGVIPRMAAPPGDATYAFPLSPHAQFSPARLQPASVHQLRAVPLYASPTQIAATVPQSPTHRADAGDIRQQPHTVLQKDVAVPGSPFGIDRAAGGNGVQGHATILPAGTAVKQLLLSPQPRLPQSSISSPLQQHMMPQFSAQQQQRQPSSATSLTDMSNSSFMDDVTRTTQQFSSPLKSTISAAVLPPTSQNSPQVSSLAQSQISAGYVQPMNQTPQQVASIVQSQPAVPSAQQKRQKPHEVTSLQGQIPAVAVQQYVIKPREGQMFPGYVAKVTAIPQQVAPPTTSVSPQHRTQNVSQEDQMQKNVASVHQLLQYRRPVPMPAASAQGGRTVTAQQLQHSPSSQRMRADVGQSVDHESHSRTSLSQSVAQAVESGTEQDRLAVLEIIKQQACEQLRQGRQPSGGQHRAVTVGSSSDQVASSRTVTSVPVQTVMPSSSQLRLLNIPQQLVPAAATSPAVQRQPKVSEQHSPQRAVPSSSNLQLTSPGFPRQPAPGTSSHAEAFLTDASRQAVMSPSQRIQAASPVVQRQPQRSEPRTPQPMHSLSSTSTPCSQSSRSSASNEHISVVNSSESVSQHDAVSADVGEQHDTTVYKEKLLKLKEKVEKTGSVERDRQKIISSQLQQLQSNITTAAETTADDVELSSSEVTIVESSDSRTSLARSSEPGENFGFIHHRHYFSQVSSSVLQVL